MLLPFQKTLRQIMRACLLAALAALAALALSAFAAEQTVLVRTESPRATLESFVQLRDAGEAAILFDLPAENLAEQHARVLAGMWDSSGESVPDN